MLFSRLTLGASVVLLVGTTSNHGIAADDCGDALNCYTQALIRLQAARDDLISARNDITTLQNDVKDLRGEISNLKRDNANLAAGIAANNGTIQGINAQLGARIGTLEGERPTAGSYILSDAFTGGLAVVCPPGWTFMGPTYIPILPGTPAAALPVAIGVASNWPSHHIGLCKRI